MKFFPHRFKKNKSYLTRGLILQAIIAQGLNESNAVQLASLNLCAAFDVININLLLKWPRIFGVPEDIVDLLKVWLNERFFYGWMLEAPPLKSSALYISGL